MKKTLLALSIVILLIVIFLPQILSTPLGKPFFEKTFGKTIHAQTSIGSLRLTWLGPQVLKNIRFFNEEIEGTIDELDSDVPFWKLNDLGKTFSLENGTFTLKTYGNVKIEKVTAKVVSQSVTATGVSTEGGDVSIKGKIYGKNDIDLIAKVHQMPPALLDTLLKTKGLLNALLGSSMDAAATYVYNQGNGIFNLDLTATYAKLSLESEITKDILTLKAPLGATLLWHPELTDLTQGHLVGAKFPITLQIDPNHTSFPIRPLNLGRLTIGHAVLDPGILMTQDLSPLISLLTLLKKGSLGSSQIPIWFTPIAFTIDEGTLHLERIDVLIANAVHLCSWGDIYLPGQLNLILGIPEDTLESSLGIQGLPRNYVLQVPVQGPIENPRYDTGPATAKITAWIAGQQATKATGVFGQLFNKLIKPSGEDQEVPPPKRPFPWE
ncbi:MAG: hypothetical protein FJZ64_04240, partial [Chlamydiae bacterium]|nr:hypothetical protein [Chlamydiota bacterium]